MENIIIILNTRNLMIELSHNDNKPGSWVVRRSEKKFGLETRVSTDLFDNKEQALVFANKMKSASNLRTV